MNCLLCDCSEFVPCIDGATGEACSWTHLAPGVFSVTGTDGICSFCAESNAPLMEDLARNVRAAIVDALKRGAVPRPIQQPLVELASEADVAAVLRTRGAGR